MMSSEPQLPVHLGEQRHEHEHPTPNQEYEWHKSRARHSLLPIKTRPLCYGMNSADWFYIHYLGPVF